MKTTECSVEIRATPAEVFDLIHDYGRRLAWDTFLSQACLLDGASAAGPGVKALCVARGGLGRPGMETVYVSFDRPRVAAVRMTRGPWFIADFAASIRQLGLADGRTRVSYKFRILARPRWLGLVLDPVLTWIFARETWARLRALKRHLESRSQ